MRPRLLVDRPARFLLCSEGMEGSSASLSALARRERARTEAAFTRMAALAGTGAWAPALEAFRAFESLLRRQMRRAEEVFFPLFEIRAGAASELTQGLQQQHREIEDRLENLLSCLRECRLDDLPGCVRALRGLLDEHDAQAGRLVYPLLDRLLSEEQRRTLVASAGE